MKTYLPSPHLLNQSLLIFILSLYVATAHIFLPLSKKKEFLFLYEWSLFVNMPRAFIYDITWDGGKTFLVRDYRGQVEGTKALSRKWHTFFYLLINKREKIKKYHSIILKFCECKNIYLVKLKGSLTDHIIYKKPLQIEEFKSL